MTEPKRTRATGIQSALMTYVQQNAGRVLTIDELLPVKAGSTRGQVSGAMNGMINRQLLPGLTPGKARGSWVFKPVREAAANRTERTGAKTALIDIYASPEGSFIGVDKDNARVYKMERIV